MRKYLKFFFILNIIIILILSISCTGQESAGTQESPGETTSATETSAILSGEEFSIQLVQLSLTKELSKEKNKWKALKYGIGYVVNFEDTAYWYVEKNSVYNLNDLAGTYAENNKNYYGIEWEKLFGKKTETTAKESPTTETVQVPGVEETAEIAIQEETTETIFSSVFKFSYINILPGIWGSKIRIVEPALVSFSDVAAGVGFIKNEIKVTGRITGSSYIQYCLSPDSGIYIQISAAIIDKNGNVNWQQDGSPGEGESDAYLKANEVKDFQLINSHTKPVNAGDELIIIAYIQGGMPEDEASAKDNIDRGVYGGYKGIMGETK